MASRQLRKLRKQQELQGQFEFDKQTAAQEDSSEDEPVVAKPRANLFAGFAALDDQGDDDDDDEKNSLDEEAKSNEPQPAIGDGSELLDGANAPGKKNKKKKNKKKKGKKSDISPTPTKAPAAEPAPEEFDEIDKAVQELNIQSSSITPSQSPSPAGKDMSEHFHINFQHLKTSNELRRMFGRTDHLVEMEEQTQQTQQTRMRNRNMGLEEYLSAPLDPRQGRPNGMSEILIRSNPFIEGKKTWPRDSAHGLKMEQTQDPDTFTYARDTSYQELEVNFMGLVQMGDPMQIVHFLRRYPYHISTLIQASRYAREQDQNVALAADLIERALFTFGRVTLTGFRKKLEQGKARIDFSRSENRQLYLAGFHHIRNLQQKGTVRTALEWAKLLFSLDLKDPYGLINFLHSLAIRANEARWFVELATTTPLLNLKLPTGRYIRQTIVLAYLQLNKQDLAREALLSGINKLPWLYCSLFSALNLDTPKCVWGIKPRDERDEFHTALYLHMTKDLWDNPNTITFLKSVASTAPTNKDYLYLPSSPSLDLATERFVYLDNTPALLSALPSDSVIRSGAMVSYDYDPLPPSPPPPPRRPFRVAAGAEAAAELLQLTGDSQMARERTRDMLLRLLAQAQGGASADADADLERQLQVLAALTANDPNWIVQFRANLERGVEEWLAGRNDNNNNDAAAAEPGRPFQATVEDAGDDEDNDIYLPPISNHSREQDQDQNQQAPSGTPRNFLRRAADYLRDQLAAGGDRAAIDTQGLPEPVYRALEDLDLPDTMPGAWGAHDGDATSPWEADADFSAITGRQNNPNDTDAGGLPRQDADRNDGAGDGTGARRG